MNFFFCFSLHREDSGGEGHSNIMENEKRMRREIANSNERRRMQSINAGFQSLRSLLPHHEGEKLSKVSANKHTYKYILENRIKSPTHKIHSIY